MKRLASATFHSAGRFLEWWLLELRSALEDLRSRLAPRWRPSVTVFVSRSGLQLVDGDPRSSVPVLDLPRSESGYEPPPPLSAEQQTTFTPGRRTCLVFDADLAFTRPLRMPLAALAHLDSALDLQTPKLLPMDRSLLRTDFEVVAVDQLKAAVDIELAALKRGDIETVERVINQLGLQLGEIHLGRPEDPRFRFKFGTSRAPVTRFAVSRVNGFWAAGALMLAFCAVAIFAIEAVRAQQSLTQALAETGAAASAALEERQALIARLETLSIVAQVERTPTAAAVLTEVTKRLNRGVWLTVFELRGRELRLVGLSAEPATTVKELAESTLITGVELRSSMSANENVGKDRFEITAQVKGGM